MYEKKNNLIFLVNFVYIIITAVNEVGEFEYIINLGSVNNKTRNKDL